jgi:hypothetical protein
MKKQIEVAVKWWTEKLNQKVAQKAGDFHMSAFATVVGNMHDAPTELQIKAFGHHMATLLNALVEAGHTDIDIEIDYEPDLLLSQCCLASEIKPERLPIKTTMVISPKDVQVSCGYGAKWETLWKTA